MQIVKRWFSTYREYCLVAGVLTVVASTMGGGVLVAMTMQTKQIDTTDVAAHVSSHDITNPAVTGHASGQPATNAAAPAASQPAQSVAQQTAATVPNVPAKQPAGLGAVRLYVDPSNHAAQYAAANPTAYGAAQIARIGQQPVAQWFGGWNSSVQSDVSTYVSEASSTSAVPVVVAYNIPNRDCGGYSAGGAQTEAAYAAWIRQLSAGIGSKPVIMILEPDAVALQTCLTGDQLAARNRELSDAIRVLRVNTQAHVYLDAGHSNWVAASDMAGRLRAAGIAGADGFALNVSNFESTANNVSYGSQLSGLTGGKHFVIDTSRNGNGATNGEWCNPAGAALGALPTLQTGNSLADAYLWIKAPWESDGSCSGAPAAGADNWPYAIVLAQAAGW